MADETNNNQNTNENGADTQPTVEELMAQLNAERESNKKLKTQVNDYSSQIADYKHKEKEKMSAEEQKAQEDKEKDEALTNALNKIARMECNEVFVNEGFKSEEYAPMVESLFGCGITQTDKVVEFAKSISKVINARVETAKELFKNDMTANNTQHPNNDTEGKGTDFKEYQKQQSESVNTGIVKL